MEHYIALLVDLLTPGNVCCLTEPVQNCRGYSEVLREKHFFSLVHEMSC